MPQLFARRTVWMPTRLGWAIFVILPLGLTVAWFFGGESFLARTDRVPADALVIEGWIGIDGVVAAKAEFAAHGYRYIVTTGGLTRSRWTAERWNYAIEARKLLLSLQIPEAEVIAATGTDSDIQRTFHSAVAVRQALEKNGLHPGAVDVMTLGAHARRSRLIFAKVLGPDTKVGVIAWQPPEYRREAWWQSSERALDFLKETVGWLFEALLNSGRTSNSSAAEETPGN